MSVLSEINEGAEVIITFKGRKVTNGYGDRYVELSQNSVFTEVFLNDKAVSVELAPEPTFEDKLRAAPTGTIVVHKFLKTSVYVKFGDGRIYQSGRGYNLDEFEDNYRIVYTPEEA